MLHVAFSVLFPRVTHTLSTHTQSTEFPRLHFEQWCYRELKSATLHLGFIRRFDNVASMSRNAWRCLQWRSVHSAAMHAGASTDVSRNACRCLHWRQFIDELCELQPFSATLAKYRSMPPHVNWGWRNPIFEDFIELWATCAVVKGASRLKRKLNHSRIALQSVFTRQVSLKRFLDPFLTLPECTVAL